MSDHVKVLINNHAFVIHLSQIKSIKRWGLDAFDVVLKDGREGQVHDRLLEHNLRRFR